MKVHGSGKQTRTYTHVGDIVSGLVHILESEQWYPVINVSTDISYSVLEVAEMVKEVTGNIVDVVHTKDRHGQIFKVFFIYCIFLTYLPARAFPPFFF